MTTSDLSILLDQKLKKLTEEIGLVRHQMATKEDLNSFATKEDLKTFQLKVQKSFTALNKRLTEDFNHLDANMMEDRKRLDRLERKVGLPKLESWQLAQI